MHLGLIAGNGRFPFLVLDAARGLGHDVTVVAIQEEAFPELADAAARPPAASVHWVSLGQLGKCISLLKGAGVAQAVMAGQVKHTKLFADIVPDMTLLAVLMRLKARNTDALISGVADALRDHGIELIDSTAFLAPLMARSGVLTRATPTEEQRADLELGYRIAPAFVATAAGQWLQEHAAEFGFVFPYTDLGQERTGYMAEPWHLRWVGRPLAALLMTDGYLDNGAVVADDYLEAIESLLQ